MDQKELFALPSPCIGVCESNNKGYCKGCLRSRDERLHWLKLSNLQKHQVLHLCHLRRNKLKQMLIHRQQQVAITLPDQMDFKF